MYKKVKALPPRPEDDDTRAWGMEVCRKRCWLKDSAVVLEEESASEAVFSSEVDNGPIRFVLLELHGKFSVWK